MISCIYLNDEYGEPEDPRERLSTSLRFKENEDTFAAIFPLFEVSQC